MDLTAFVDVAIGLSIMYLGASLVTLTNEYIAQLFELRTGQLKKDLARLIDDPAVVASLSRNPALEPLFRQRQSFLQRLMAAFPLSLVFGSPQKTPSFVDPNMLAQQLVGTLHDRSEPFTTAWQLLGVLDRLPDSSLKAQLQALARTADADMDAFVTKVGSHIDRTLAAMGEVYKRKVQLISLGVGLAIAVGFNLDTLLVAQHLYRDKEAREATVAVAMQVAQDKDLLKKCLAAGADSARNEVECRPIAGLAGAVAGRNATLGKLPLGWENWHEAVSALGLAGSASLAPVDGAAPGTLHRWIGLFLTALAISLGAAFWFDLLTRLVNIRHAMRKPETDSKPV